MSDDRDFNANSSLDDAITALLKFVLPAERHDLIPQLSGLVAGFSGVIEHRGKLWGELSQAEADRVAHLAGVIAREILQSTAEKKVYDPTPDP